MKNFGFIFEFSHQSLANYYKNIDLGYFVAKELFKYVFGVHYLIFDKTAFADQNKYNELLLYINQITKEDFPYQYILKYVKFCDADINIVPPILIPRVETESLVYWIMIKMKALKNKKLDIIDFCSGSGCIGIALLKFFNKSYVTAFDISYKAVNLASFNAIYNGVRSRYKIYQKDIFSLKKNKIYDIIISNPPYISFNQYQCLDKSVSKWEDKIALTDGGDGTSFVDYLICNSKFKMKKNSILIIEICDSYSDFFLEKAKNIFKKNLVFLWRDQYQKKRAIVVVKGIYQKYFNGAGEAI